MGTYINPDRVVTITRTTGGDNSDWRHNLSHILGKTRNAGAEQKMFSNDILSNTVVSNDIELLMDTGTGFGTDKSSQWKTPVQDMLNGLGSSNEKLAAIGKVISGGVQVISALANSYSDTGQTSGTWQPWMEGVQAWAGAKSGQEFSYTFKFSMGQYGLWNAKEEVVKPILNLIAPTLPQYLNSFTMAGPYPNAAQLLTNMLFGDGLKKAFSGLKEDFSGFSLESLSGENWKSTITSALSGVNKAFESLGEFLEDLMISSYEEFTYTVKFGKIIQFDRVIIKAGSAKFSHEVDQYGYPVSGSIDLTCVGMVPLSMTASNANQMAVRFGLQKN